MRPCSTTRPCSPIDERAGAEDRCARAGQAPTPRSTVGQLVGCDRRKPRVALAASPAQRTTSCAELAVVVERPETPTQLAADSYGHEYPRRVGSASSRRRATRLARPPARRLRRARSHAGFALAVFRVSIAVERSERRRHVADDPTVVAGDVAGMRVSQHAGVAGAERARRPHARRSPARRRSHVSSAFALRVLFEQRQQAVGVERRDRRLHLGIELRPAVRASK